VAIATGASWRRDGVGRWHRRAIPGHEHAGVFTPDDVMAGAVPEGPVVVFDDDHYYMGGIVAEKLRRDGREVVLVTPSGEISDWTTFTIERERIQTRLLELGVHFESGKVVAGFDGASVDLACAHTGRTSRLPAASLVMVTARIPRDELYFALETEPEALSSAGIVSLARIGDCSAPGTIAAAVYAGHEFARGLDVADPKDAPFRRERAVV
jgi:dimethylamine/trimethylamine dehydrogenase